MDRLYDRDTLKSRPTERGTWTSDVSEEVLTLTANRHSRRLRRPIVVCLLVLAAGLAWTVTAPNALADDSPPDIQVDVDPAPNANGWHNTDVTVTWTISDEDDYETFQDCATSGTQSGTIQITNNLTNETDGTTLTCEAEDGDGNTIESVTIRIDKTDPEITGSKSPAANTRGWNDDAQVDVTFDCNDVGSVQSGIDTDTTDSTTTLTEEGADQTVTSSGDCVDQAGNAAAAETVIVNIDRTPPDVSSSQTPNFNANEWNNTDVEVTWNVNDGISGVVSLDGCGKTSLAAETTGTTIECTATDAADNETTASRTIRIDKTRPVITGTRSPGPNEFGWNNENVAVSFTCADTGSVQSSVNDGDPVSVDDVADNDQTLTNDGENQSVTSPGADCVDRAGNPALDEVVGPINIDSRAPEVTHDFLNGPNGNGWFNFEPVTILFTCAETGEGVVDSGIAFDTVTNEEQFGEGEHTIDKPSDDDAFFDENSGEECIDRAGNLAPSVTVSGVNIDLTPPEITCDVTPQSLVPDDAASGDDCRNSSGELFSSADWEADEDWTNQNVDVDFSCEDELSGVDVNNFTSDPDETLMSEGRNRFVEAFGTDNCVDMAGNESATVTVSGINIDKTAPVIGALQDPQPNNNGWHNEDVTVRFNCADASSKAQSGIEIDTISDQTVSSEGENQSVTAVVDPLLEHCVDKAGNQAADKTVSGINIDKTPPQITGTRSPAANANGWNDENVTVTFSCAEVGSVQSGIDTNDPDTGSDPEANISKDTVSGTSVTVSSEGSNQSATNTGECIDVAGNQAAPATVSNINIDKTAPVITGERAPQPNENGWNNQDVTVTFECADVDANGIEEGVFGFDGSGVETDTVAGDTVGEGENQSVTNTGECSDGAGNAASLTTIDDINVDKTDPEIEVNREPAPNADGWNISDVAVTFDCVDTGSEQSGRDDGETTLGGDTILATEGENQSVQSVGTCVDRAGNSESDASVTVSIDKTPPTVEITDNPPEISDDTTAEFTFDPTDSLSGIEDVECRLDDAAFASCDSNSSETLTGLTEGQHTFEVRAVDVAGNTGSPASFTWNIIPSDPSEFAVEIADGPPEGSFTSNTAATFVFSVNIAAPVSLDTECRIDEVGSFNACTSPHTLRSLGEGEHTFEVRAVTPTGQRSDIVTRTWNVDLTPPTLDATVSPAPNANGWHDEDVTVEFTCSDPASNGVSSGVDVIASGTASSNTGTLQVTLSEEAEGQSRTGICDDVAGNRSTETVTGINIDKTQPEITGTRRPRANDDGWNNSEVTVRFECTNPGPSSIVADTVAGGTVSSEGEDQSVTSTGDCVDAAGNAADPATVGGINIDRTAPTMTGNRDPAANDAGWNNEEVTVAFACVDTGDVQSGVGVDTVSKEVTLSAEGAEQTVTSEGSCIDRAGNPTDQSTISVTVNIDLTPPAVTLSAPEDGARFEQGTQVAANFLADDDLSGMRTVNSPVPSGSLIDTGSLGEQEFSVTAVDRADNATTVTHTYDVLILPPEVQAEVLERIEEDLQEQLDEIVGDPEFEPGDGIELCLSFEDSRAERLLTEAPVDPKLFRTFEDEDPEPVRELETFEFDDERDVYCLTFATTDGDGEPLPPGTYDLVIAFGDGTAVRVDFSLDE